MKTDERGYFDSLSERVLGAVIEVSKTLGAGFPKKCTSERCSEKLAFAASVEEVLVVELKWWNVSTTNTPPNASTTYEPPHGCLSSDQFPEPKAEWKRIVLGFSQ
jgi:hypothetical protein